MEKEINFFNQGPDGLYPATETITWLADQAVKLRADDEEIISNPPVSMVTAFKSVAERFPDKVAIVDCIKDDEIYTYKRYYDEVVHVAKTFIKLGLESYHGVGIIGYNAPQYFIAYMASIFAGGIAATIHHANSDDTIKLCANVAACNIILVEDDKLLKIILKIRKDLPNLKAIIQYRGKPNNGMINVYSWEEIMNMNVDNDYYEDEFKRRILNIAPNKCCALVATSGTTGQPRWVMLSHDNITWFMRSFVSFVNEGEPYCPYVVISYQALSHISAQKSDIFWPICCGGGTVYIAKPEFSKGTLIETLKKIRPTIFIGGPKIFETIMDNILTFEKGSNMLKQKVVSWARKNTKNQENTKFISKFIITKLAAIVGLDRCRLAFVGGITCKREILEFYMSIGVPLMECYGISECTTIATNTRSHFKLNTVGRMICGVKMKQVLWEEGDENIQRFGINGRNVFMGYLGNEEETKKVFDDDYWFYTGDIGMVDSEGFLSLHGRVNDVIIIGDCSKIYPMPIEKRIIDQMPCLSYCVVVGEGRNFLSALLVFKTVIDPTNGQPTDYLDLTGMEWCRNLEINAKKLSDIVNSKNPKINKEIQKVIDRANDLAIADKELILKWKILKTNFSVKGGELGVTLKVRRKYVNEIHKRDIEELYGN